MTPKMHRLVEDVRERLNPYIVTPDAPFEPFTAHVGHLHVAGVGKTEEEAIFHLGVRSGMIPEIEVWPD